MQLCKLCEYTLTRKQFSRKTNIVCRRLYQYQDHSNVLLIVSIIRPVRVACNLQKFFLQKGLPAVGCSRLCQTPDTIRGNSDSDKNNTINLSEMGYTGIYNFFSLLYSLKVLLFYANRMRTSRETFFLYEIIRFDNSDDLILLESNENNQYHII